jgi:hypothetical protein
MKNIKHDKNYGKELIELTKKLLPVFYLGAIFTVAENEVLKSAKNEKEKRKLKRMFKKNIKEVLKEQEGLHNRT